MPVWERNCPKCGTPMKVDTQSSKLYCSYCNAQFWTDEFLNNRTKYHTEEKEESDWRDNWFAPDNATSHSVENNYAHGFGNNQKIWNIKPEESKFFGSCRNLAFFSFVLAFSGTSLGSIGFLIFLFIGILLFLLFAFPACLSYLEVAINKSCTEKLGFIRVGTLVATIIFIAGIIIGYLVLFKPFTPEWQGTYYPDHITVEQNEKEVDLKGTTTLTIDKDGYVLKLNLTLPTTINTTLQGSYNENNGHLTFDTENLYMYGKRIYFMLDLREEGYGIMTIEYTQ